MRFSIGSAHHREHRRIATLRQGRADLGETLGGAAARAMSFRQALWSQVEFSECLVQMTLLRAYCQPVALRNVVCAHGELDYSPIQCEPMVQQLVGIDPPRDSMGEGAALLFGWLGHFND